MPAIKVDGIGELAFDKRKERGAMGGKEMTLNAYPCWLCETPPAGRDKAILSAAGKVMQSRRKPGKPGRNGGRPRTLPRCDCGAYAEKYRPAGHLCREKGEI